jgi:hypothetical protein
VEPCLRVLESELPMQQFNTWVRPLQASLSLISKRPRNDGTMVSIAMILPPACRAILEAVSRLSLSDLTAVRFHPCEIGARRHSGERVSPARRGLFATPLTLLPQRLAEKGWTRLSRASPSLHFIAPVRIARSTAS